jgi:hypothetical protein
VSTEMSIDDVARFALQLPEVTEGQRYGMRTWFVKGKGFVWERPFSKADIKRFGTEGPPSGPILAVATSDLHEKEAILASGTAGVFTIEHFKAYPAVLIQLHVASKQEVCELITDAWLALAPKKLAVEHLLEKEAL